MNYVKYVYSGPKYLSESEFGQVQSKADLNVRRVELELHACERTLFSLLVIQHGGRPFAGHGIFSFTRTEVSF